MVVSGAPVSSFWREAVALKIGSCLQQARSMSRRDAFDIRAYLLCDGWTVKTYVKADHTDIDTSISLIKRILVVNTVEKQCERFMFFM